MLEKIINLLEEILEREPGSVAGVDEFREYEEWDSLAYLAVIAAIDDEFGIVIPVDAFRSCKTVNELAEFVNKNREQ